MKVIYVTSKTYLKKLLNKSLRFLQSFKLNPKKEKDPKKVAAGKKLAAYNKEAKEALSRERGSVKLRIKVRLGKLIHLEKVHLVNIKDGNLQL